jgi:hypothetical protein
MHRARGSECGAEYAEAYLLVEAKPGVPLLPLKLLSKLGTERQLPDTR